MTIAPDPAARSLGDLGHAAQSPLEAPVTPKAAPPVSVLVTDDDIVAARARLWHDYRIASEHGAATAMAALLFGGYVPADGERVAVVICGANTDPATLA